MKRFKQMLAVLLCAVARCGLAPAALYRVTISYDSSRYYQYGLMKVEGIAG